jgi:phosphate transport system ATP-binding protein
LLNSSECSKNVAVSFPALVSFIVNDKMTPPTVSTTAEYTLRTENLSVYYGKTVAVKNVFLDIQKHKITAFIGPSGCGKSTVLRCFNRMNDLIPSARVEGNVLFEEMNLYGNRIDPVAIRRKIGMVFQKPNPFPKSIYENITFGARINGYKGNLDELVEQSLIRAALWDEVKDKLKASGLSLSGGSSSASVLRVRSLFRQR